MQDNFNIERNVLQDIKNGKPVRWKDKKSKTLKLADSYKRLENKNKSLRVKYCGTNLIFSQEQGSNKLKLHKANFCRVRLCPMCAWRKSLKCFWQVSKAMDKVQEENKNLVPLFLTLTVKNCNGDELSAMLDKMFKAWNRLNSRTKIKRIVKGWFRALEVTYNAETDTFHPHIHAIMLVEKGYFKSKDYMETSTWVEMWQKSLDIDYMPICDIRKIKGKKTKSVAEVAKYTVKDTDYINDNVELMDKLVLTLDGALANRRLLAYGGVLKQAYKDLKMQNIENSNVDLVHIDDTIREDIGCVLLTYKWRFGIGNYELIRKEIKE